MRKCRISRGCLATVFRLGVPSGECDEGEEYDEEHNHGSGFPVEENGGAVAIAVGGKRG